MSHAPTKPPFFKQIRPKKIMLPRPCTQPLHRPSPEDAATKYEPEYEQLFTISFKQVLYFSKYHQFTAWFITKQNNESCTIWFLFYIVLRWQPHFILHNCPSACFPILCPVIPDFANFVFVKKRLGNATIKTGIFCRCIWDACELPIYMIYLFLWQQFATTPCQYPFLVPEVPGTASHFKGDFEMQMKSHFVQDVLQILFFPTFWFHVVPSSP